MLRKKNNGIRRSANFMKQLLIWSIWTINRKNLLEIDCIKSSILIKQYQWNTYHTDGTNCSWGHFDSTKSRIACNRAKKSNSSSFGEVGLSNFSWRNTWQTSKKYLRLSNCLPLFGSIRKSRRNRARGSREWHQGLQPQSWTPPSFELQGLRANGKNWSLHGKGTWSGS